MWISDKWEDYKVLDLADGKKLGTKSGAKVLTLAGGVASNSGLRNTMNDKCQKAGIRLVMPPPILCTDNAAMIGSAAFYRLMRGEIAGLDLNATPSLRLV